MPEKATSWEDLEIVADDDFQTPPKPAPKPVETPPKPTSHRPPGAPKTPAAADSSKTEEEFYYQTAPQDIRKILVEQLDPFIEPDGPKGYATDSADSIVPAQPSFVSDFINLGRATESPTIFLLWGALWTLSAALNRNAWISWYPKPLWPNLYTIFVAPAGICKKSTPIDLGRWLLKASQDYHMDTVEAYENSFRFVTSKSSPAGVYMMLMPDSRIFVDAPNRKLRTAHRSSKVTLCIPELATLLSKQQFMVGLVNDITNLYDCPEEDSEITRERGFEPLEKVYVTLAGAITPTGLEESLPKEALSGGLISRSVIVYQDMPSKIYSRPSRLAGYPELADIGKKLGWIAHNARGEYEFTHEAEEAFNTWYVEWKSHMIAGDIVIREDETRKDIILRKVAMLLRVAEYRPGTEITLQNFEDAKAIVEFTMSYSARLMVGIGGNEFVKKLAKVKNYLEKRKTVGRRQILNRFGGEIQTQELNILLTQLSEQGFLLTTLDEKVVQRPTFNLKESYAFSSPGEIYGR